MTGRRTTPGDRLVVRAPQDLDRDGVRAVADGHPVVLGESLEATVGAVRAAALAALERSGPVYGVSTGMGDQSRVPLDEDARRLLPDTLMLGRAVGSAPWLTRRQTRALLATRLRSFLGGDAAVSVDLCRCIVALLNADVLPAIPATSHGASGEIIALAHLGALITGSGSALDADDSAARPAVDALAAAGLQPYPLEVKEGVALLQGVPITTALALLVGDRARALADRTAVVAGTGIAVIAARRDPYEAVLARGDAELATALHRLREVAGPESAPRGLQAPVSFRVVGPALAHMDRCATALEAAVTRALDGVTDSPAFLEGRFIGSAGFDGFDLAASLHAVSVAAARLAETSAARLHRLLDDRVTGLPRQLADTPGLHAGLVAVHKRAIGAVHRLRHEALTSGLGAADTSLGQEDIQSYSIQVAQAADAVLGGLDEVLACELLAVHQAVQLGGRPARLGAAGARLLDAAAAVLPAGTTDRPFGRDIDSLRSQEGTPAGHRGSEAVN